MFTGIVEEIGTVAARRADGMTISATAVIGDLKEGASISVNGACLTATGVSAASFTVDIVPETIRRTNLGLLKVGDGVNLERPLAAGGRLDGHIVQGHVDGTGTVRRVEREKDALLVSIQASPGILRYVVDKGFIAVDGASLTVVKCHPSYFTVTIIPYTQTRTLFGARRVGDVVNLEVDILAKYVEKLVHANKPG